MCRTNRDAHGFHGRKKVVGRQRVQVSESHFVVVEDLEVFRLASVVKNVFNGGHVAGFFFFWCVKIRGKNVQGAWGKTCTNCLLYYSKCKYLYVLLNECEIIEQKKVGDFKKKHQIFKTHEKTGYVQEGRAGGGSDETSRG